MSHNNTLDTQKKSIQMTKDIILQIDRTEKTAVNTMTQLEIQKEQLTNINDNVLIVDDEARFSAKLIRKIINANKKEKIIAGSIIFFLLLIILLTIVIIVKKHA
jgi:hypothetical protein